MLETTKQAPVSKNVYEKCFHKRSLAQYQLLEEIQSGKLVGYVQCDIVVPNNLQPHFANFPPLFKNTLVDRKDIVKLMKQYAEEEGLMSQC